MGHGTFRVGHAAGALSKRSKRADSDCAKGGLYVSPSSGDVINSLDELEVTWTPSCLSTSTVDLHLYAPARTTSKLHTWQNVDNTEGSYNVTLMQRWWDAESNVQLQLRIVERGESPFLSAYAAGPIFNATYQEPADGAPVSADTTQSDDGVTVVGATSSSGSSQISKGGVAAAVIFPLLFAALCVAAYIRWQRQKRTDKSKAFTEHVDKRMSTISTDWKSLSAKGANHAIRNSMSVGPGNRSSGFSFGAIRPASSFDADGGAPQMHQLRPQTQFSTTDRISRVSFAEGTRPSAEARRSTAGQSRAFHHSFAPPMPAISTRQGSADNLGDGVLSPTQTEGAVSLTPEAIRARISIAGGQDDVGPALSMMRSLNGEYDNRSSTYPQSTSSVYNNNSHSMYYDDEDLVGQYITAPPPAAMRGETLFTSSPVTSPTSAFPNSPFGNNGFSAMSPDEMLRAYAAGRNGPSSPTAGGMRVMSPPMSPANERRRTLLPAGPGAMSASRGAYDVSIEEDVGHAR